MGHLEEFNRQQDDIDRQFYLDGQDAKKLLDFLMSAHSEETRNIECVGGPFDGQSFPYVKDPGSIIIELVWCGCPGTEQPLPGPETHHYELAYRGNKKFFWRWIGLAHQ